MEIIDKYFDIQGHFDKCLILTEDLFHFLTGNFPHGLRWMMRVTPLEVSIVITAALIIIARSFVSDAVAVCLVDLAVLQIGNPIAVAPTVIIPL